MDPSQFIVSLLLLLLVVNVKGQSVNLCQPDSCLHGGKCDPYTGRCSPWCGPTSQCFLEI
ncbi:hypothetical protein TrispH2_002646 [Trichoplax sp. H2]|nr:hypothetical protein TrispH2_002646 [Trichoplax sp. H2]|eukprot:RDD45438.1 hypothetical protein TrispH2_002646 [Trichoplax sp. H2]